MFQAAEKVLSRSCICELLHGVLAVCMEFLLRSENQSTVSIQGKDFHHIVYCVFCSSNWTKHFLCAFVLVYRHFEQLFKLYCSIQEYAKGYSS